MWKKFLAAALMSILCACSGLGLAPATNAQQQIAYDYAALATARQTAANALQQGTITVSTAQNILTATDDARKTLDSAQAMLAQGTPDLTNVQNDLALVTKVLTEVQSMLPKQ
jgi:UDP-glucose 6-dehydrogenase